ncbi:hypothetical protein HaLaN_25119 [Haematococcus lacustris]|uniref:Uncharacterized protein n=1 Tax=Haematococcus lacustris TaxID=44745 RepID=A0A6A0A3P4_HAELA|nr:hypothetical protein HaLaN_25119 [Haematococcus lacustris]
MGSMSQLSMEDYIELYSALTKSGDKVATFDARGEACFTAKDLAQHAFSVPQHMFVQPIKL